MTFKPLWLLSLGLTLALQPAAAQQNTAAKPAATSATGTKLVEKVTRKGTELVIPYEKYVLPNGLTLLIHEDHSDPIAHVDVTYHVGSAREQIGKSGFAHFFEHMMFQGSDHVADEQHFKLVTSSGGTLNGTTNRDRTNYFETVPSNQLETALWLESDRMGFLLDAVTQQKFEVQRSTVKNERGQNYDNRPYGLASENVAKALYPYGHPYSWLTIGYLEDLDRSNVDDLKNFFLRWYGPNNATVTVGGDVKPAEVVKLVEKYFGSINRGPAVQNMKLPAPTLTQDRYVHYEDNVRFPMLQMVFPTVPQYHPDEVAIDALAEIIGGGKNSLLYKNLIKTQKSVQTRAYHPTSELGGEFTIMALSLPGKGLDSTELIVRRTMAEFEKRGVTDDDVARFKATREADVVNGLASVSGKVSQLAAYQTFAGNPNRLPQELQRIRSLTKADVQRVYNQYIKGKKAVVLSVVPKGSTALVAKADNFTVSKDGYKAPATDEYAGLKYAKATDSFDRSVQPKGGANPVIQVPAVWRQEFDNGLKIIGNRNTEIPTVTMLLTIRGGHRLEQQNRNKAGVASLTAAMLEEGTQKYTGEQFAAALEKLGSDISTNAGDDNTTIVVRSLTKNLPATLALLEEVLMRPRFAQADFDRLKKQTLEGIANQSTQPVAIANNTYARLLYGPGDVMSIPTSGSTTSVQGLTLDDVKQFYQQNYAPNVSYLTVVGDVDQKDVLPRLGFLKTWGRKAVTLPASDPNPQPDKTRIYFVNKDGAAQSEIRVGYLTPLTYDATGDFYRAYLANYILGGAFNSRINLNLREDKGYTYGARSGFQSTRYVGPYTAQAGVRADATAASVKEFVKEIKDYRNGATDEELQFLQASVGQSDALKYETGQQKAAFLGRLLEYDLPTNYVSQQSEILKNLKREDLQTSAQKYLPIDQMYIVVVGDRTKAFPGLSELGYEVVELDLNGNKVATLTAPAAAAPSAPAVAPATAEKMKMVKKDKEGKKKRKQKTNEDGTAGKGE
ncbi:insulinase family protein [Microvirga sp. STR05]|uniref:Insulinase family protein n=1 Tax=Hymenobacter duratus TaxID=2771356 RepID=A0ABR8JC56_9BACT|nr:pitrilysin family protein [Hymenobacter duratus]MBD2713472.1 insulinase family protein [Hymenobacter duratus]MBR7948374.1 insulinase family protein [Microvirga sp. STR05]